MEHRCGALGAHERLGDRRESQPGATAFDELVRRYIGRLPIGAAATVLVLSATDGTLHRERVVGACDSGQPSVAAATGGRPALLLLASVRQNDPSPD